MMHNVELKPGKGGQIARSAGSAVQLVAKEGDYASVKMPSGEIRKINVDCLATIGQVGNVDHENVSIGKAGRSRWLGKRPHVRGVAMNPVDHPLGGGEGKTSGGRHPVSPWGDADQGLQDAEPQGARTASSSAETEIAVPQVPEARVSWNKMSRSLKKGPFVDVPAPREGRSDEPRRRQEGHQDLVAPIDRRARDGGAHASRCTTGASSSRSTSPRTWSGTSSASSRRRGSSRATRPRATRRRRWRRARRRRVRNGSAGARDGEVHPHLGAEGRAGARPDPRP